MVIKVKSMVIKVLRPGLGLVTCGRQNGDAL